MDSNQISVWNNRNIESVSQILFLKIMSSLNLKICWIGYFRQENLNEKLFKLLFFFKGRLHSWGWCWIGQWILTAGLLTSTWNLI